MDEEDDILFTRAFVSKPPETEFSHANVQDYINYKNKEKENDEIQLIKKQLDNNRTLKRSKSYTNVKLDQDEETALGYSEYNTQFKPLHSNLPQSVKLQEVVRSTRRNVISIDSRHKDNIRYPNANSFEINFGRTFQNVVKVELLSAEFPNTDSVIKSSNNTITWINEEDEDLDFPEYSVQIRVGSYDAVGLETEMQNQLNSVRRRDGSGEYHSFLVDIDLETDIVSIVSLNQVLLTNNPFDTTINSGTIIVNHPSHGLSTGDTVYVSGTRTLSGIQPSIYNTNHIITVIGPNAYSFELNINANETLTGGGNNIRIGTLLPFKILFGKYSGISIGKLLGFKSEDTSKLITTSNPLTTKILPIQGFTIGNVTTIVSNNHGLQVGDTIRLRNFVSIPTVYEITDGSFEVFNVLDQNQFQINFETTFIDATNISNSSIQTDVYTLNFLDHGFNEITDITNFSPNVVKITTFLNHGFQTGDNVKLSSSNSIPDVNGYYTITKIDDDEFTINFVGGVITPGTSGVIGVSNTFTLYGSDFVSNVPPTVLNNIQFSVREIVDENTINFNIPNVFPDENLSGGGDTISISSYLHGFNSTILNTENNILNKPISLQGEDYAFLCSSTLTNMISTGTVENIFAKIVLSDDVGTVLFNTFVSNPKIFEDPLPRLESLFFEVKIYDGSYYDFQGIDYSFTLAIYEELTEIKGSRINSRFLSKTIV